MFVLSSSKLDFIQIINKTKKNKNKKTKNLRVKSLQSAVIKYILSNFITAFDKRYLAYQNHSCTERYPAYQNHSCTERYLAYQSHSCTRHKPENIFKVFFFFKTGVRDIRIDNILTNTIKNFS